MIIEGIVKPDGTLEVPLETRSSRGTSPGHRSVLDRTDPARSVLEDDGIARRFLRTSGRAPRTPEEIDAEIDALRNESEEEMQAVEEVP